MTLSTQFIFLIIAMTALTVSHASHAKLGGTTTRHLQSGQCVICSKDDKTKPDYLTLGYVPQGVDSEYQDSSKASCVGGPYPTTTTLEVTTKDGAMQSFEDVKLGSVFTVLGQFDANTEFKFSDGSGCTIHTSCSAPLVAGDQIGPFKVLGGNECGNFPTGPPTEQCVICSNDDKTKPAYLTLEYVPQGVDSEYQDSSKASCVGGVYPDTTTLEVTNKDGDMQFFDVQVDTVFTVLGQFDANTEFFFSGGSGCTIHTSCSAPLVAGDQIGPFKVLGGNECDPPSLPPFGESIPVSPSSLPSTTASPTSPTSSPFPSGSPSAQPSAFPSLVPSASPSNSPSATAFPSSQPTGTPSPPPSTTMAPTQPTSTPSTVPTAAPSAFPSSQPTGTPSTVPTAAPSAFPSSQPTGTPSIVPTAAPSASPSSQPTSTPSIVPTAAPSVSPTNPPTTTTAPTQPTSTPSTVPTAAPSAPPSNSPTITMAPTQPTSTPSTVPTAAPSPSPSISPTVTAAPTKAECVEADRSRYRYEVDPIKVSYNIDFNPAGPLLKGWVCIYPCDVTDYDLNSTMWVCGAAPGNCISTDSTGEFAFNEFNSRIPWPVTRTFKADGSINDSFKAVVFRVEGTPDCPQTTTTLECSDKCFKIVEFGEICPELAPECRV